MGLPTCLAMLGPTPSRHHHHHPSPLQVHELQAALDAAAGQQRDPGFEAQLAARLRQSEQLVGELQAQVLRLTGQVSRLPGRGGSG